MLIFTHKSADFRRGAAKIPPVKSKMLFTVASQVLREAAWLTVNDIISSSSCYFSSDVFTLFGFNPLLKMFTGVCIQTGKNIRSDAGPRPGQKRVSGFQSIWQP